MAKKTSVRQYLLCVNNAAYPGSLETRKVYRSVPDAAAENRGLVCVVDESGSDFLYSADRFVKIDVPPAAAALLDSSEGAALADDIKRELDRRKANLQADPDSGLAWEEVKRRVQAKKSGSPTPNWYIAHVVMAFCLTKHPQKRFPVWEDMYLITANSGHEAWNKAEQLGREQEGDSDGSLRVGGKPAVLRFMGVRKIVECVSPDERPGDGTEVSYNDLGFDSLRDVKRFADGLAVSLRCARILTPEDRQKSPSAGKSKKPRKGDRGKKGK